MVMGFSKQKKPKITRTNTTIELIVHIDCRGCENKIKKVLKNLEGVEEVDVDMNLQKVTVMGWADQEEILKAIRKAGKMADMWPYTPESQHNFNVHQYYRKHHHHNNNNDDSISFCDSSVFPNVSSDYFFHKGHDHLGSYYDQEAATPFSTIVDDNTNSMFSDDNPHACTIT